MNFKDFKKVDVTKTHTVFKHPNGHTIQIAHDSLPPEIKKQMREIPVQSAKERLREQREAKKMADGGEVEEDAFQKFQSEMEQTKTEESVAKPYSLPVTEKRTGKPLPLPDYLPKDMGVLVGSMKGTLSDVPTAEQTKELQQLKMEATEAQASKPVLENAQIEMPQDQPTVPSTSAIGAAIGMEGALQQIEGAKNIAESQKAKALAETEAIGQSLQQMQQSLTAAQAQRQKVQVNIDRLTQAVESGTLKPDRVLGSGNNKVMNIIGLVLGGAMQFATLGIVPNLVQKAIDDDIEQQKSELEQKNNLLSYNLKLLGNINDAENVTRMQMATIADLQARKAALKSADKEAMGRYQIFSGELQSKLIAPAMQQMEQQAAMQQAASQPVTSPTQVIQMIEARIPKGSRRTAIDEYAKHKQVNTDIERIKTIMREQADLNTLANRLGSPIQSTKILKAKKAQMFPIIKGIVGEKMTEEDVKQMVDPFLVSITTSPETVNTLTDQLIATVMSRAGSITPTLELYGINLPKPVQSKPLSTIKRK